MTHAPTVFSTDSNRGFRVAFWLFFGAITFIPTTIAAVQWLTSKPGAELPTNPWGILPGALIVAGCVSASTMKELLVVDPAAKTLSFQSTVFGWAYRSATWAWSDVASIEALPNSRVRSRGWRADIRGPKGRRTICSYFHRRPPEHIHELAKQLRVPLNETQ